MSVGSIQAFGEFVLLSAGEDLDSVSQQLANEMKNNLRAHRRTGELEDSIRVDAYGGLKRLVSVNADYAEAVESKIHYVENAITTTWK